MLNIVEGTASITLAGIINAAKIVGKDIKDMTYSMVGAGAANMAIARVMIAAGIPIKNIIMIDSKGILSADRPEVQDGSWLAAGWDLKHKMATESNGEGIEANERQIFEVNRQVQRLIKDMEKRDDGKNQKDEAEA